MRLRVLAVLAVLSSPASARELAGLNMSPAAEVPVAGQGREVRPPAPNFAFYSARAQAIVAMRKTPELEARVQREAQAMGMPPLEVRELQGKVVLLYFWGAGGKVCPACPQTIALMEGLDAEFSLAGLRVVGLAVMGGEGDIRNASGDNRHLMGKPLVGDPIGELGLGSIPSWALIDRQGSVVAKSQQVPDRAYLAEKIKEALARR